MILADIHGAASIKETIYVPWVVRCRESGTAGMGAPVNI